MSETDGNTDPAVRVHNRGGRGGALIVCEHASRSIPGTYGNLGLTPELLRSHIAWDPGALPVAQHLSAAFDAPLVAGGLSRLLFDCNRPPEAPDAIPQSSENHPVPGNRELSETDRAARVQGIHDAFRDGLSEARARFSALPVLITVHSFTPVYLGVSRPVQIGLLHDTDDRLARAMLERAKAHTDLTVALNDPYGPRHGVTHTLRRYALPIGALNIMLEIRNDLIADAASQADIAALLARWIADATKSLNTPLTLQANA
ncbi:N-formylglutamate amidohydrolase [Sedimentitalea nanhaiensis]|uniref:Predicted N-formylglutamate amidohydrolase n=1 Tax=Sedimentitalea nanhaiensis TaxID=999627 RepID=A0A1I6YYJ1_9RHOB|nr:N-formylglutamate amidohydrolase [Sedimentitalea nanhaiensis]SFT55573.1 Predicted N-formylglutamate amidohydrolase [Sedimentitalea nanhaiensis]